ncbi:hypothetical protein L210DRAFT_3504514 [Boletus edulis BED1]|uniref:Uncharacterized protein n=1 Tax=Boletus edulis BED1 TaxID=1328754 RepID=A0AAD4BTA6_BOLED|nr:hypothetical protein L210DRAFT_3504514 [Boletus edulis BED1]
MRVHAELVDDMVTPHAQHWEDIEKWFCMHCHLVLSFCILALGSQPRYTNIAPPNKRKWPKLEYILPETTEDALRIETTFNEYEQACDRHQTRELRDDSDSEDKLWICWIYNICHDHRDILGLIHQCLVELKDGNQYIEEDVLNLKHSVNDAEDANYCEQEVRLFRGVLLLKAFDTINNVGKNGGLERGISLAWNQLQAVAEHWLAGPITDQIENHVYSLSAMAPVSKLRLASWLWSLSLKMGCSQVTAHKWVLGR